MQKKLYQNGTHRHCTPEETLERITPFLKDMGITRVANLSGLDDSEIPVISVYRPNARSLATSQGKGHSLTAAKVSGIMESIEIFHAENIDTNTTIDCLKKLPQKIDYTLLPQSIKKDFNEDTIIEWFPCKNLKNNSTVLLPYELIHTQFTVPNSKFNGYFIAGSNGLASGNTITEAINHGMCEIIERDCLTLWQLTPPELHHNKRIDPTTIKDPYLLNILKKLETKNIHFGIWDITSDINIPTFLCKIVSDKNTGIRPAYGSGTHLNKSVALSRAITEAVQSRITFIAGARDDQYHDIYENEISQDVYQLWLDELTNLQHDKMQSFETIKSIDFDTLEEDQDYILSSLEKVGLHDVFYADLTKEKYNIPVVKVIIPGTESIDEEERLLGHRGLNFYEKYGFGACEVIS